MAMVTSGRWRGAPPPAAQIALYGAAHLDLDAGESLRHTARLAPGHQLVVGMLSQPMSVL
jgi:hypothetical protein